MFVILPVIEVGGLDGWVDPSTSKVTSRSTRAAQAGGAAMEYTRGAAKLCSPGKKHRGEAENNAGGSGPYTEPAGPSAPTYARKAQVLE